MLVRALIESNPREIITAFTSTSISEAMDLLIRHGIGCLPVIDKDHHLVGIISDKDIFKVCYETKGNYQNLTVGEVMTSNPIVGLPEDDISYIAGLMEKNWIRHVPIVDGGKIIGLVSLRDINRTVAQSRDLENRYLTMYLDGLHSRDRSSDA